MRKKWAKPISLKKQEYPDRSIAGIPFRIVDAIKKLFKKLKDYIAGVIDKIKLVGVEKKVKQLEEMKKDPEIASIKVKLEDPQEQQRHVQNKAGTYVWKCI